MTDSSLNHGRLDLVTLADPATSTGTPRQLFGQRPVDKTVSSGLFVCPHEGLERAYWKHRVRNWLSFLSMPLIPVEVVGEYVECFCCGGITDPATVGAQHPSLGTLGSRA